MLPFTDNHDPLLVPQSAVQETCLLSQTMPMQAAGLGGWYNESNVGISGIHTHSGPGGYLQYVLYDITSLGFVEQSWEAVVDGIATVSC